MTGLKWNFILSLSILMFALVSCERANRDPLEPGLPEYTQTGKNAVGAEINELLWRDFNLIGFYGGQSYMSIKYDTISNASRVSFAASLITGKLSSESASVYFDFKDRLIMNQEDLFSLDDSEWQINGTSLDAGIESNYFDAINCTDNRSCTGNLFIRKARPITNDQDAIYNVICGTFGFSVMSDCGKINVFMGRFDYEFKQIHFTPDSL